VRLGPFVAAALALGAALPAAAQIRLPAGPGVEQVYARCRTCHDLQYVVDGKGLLPDQWRAVLASMKDYSLTLPEDERERILHYLTTYLGPHPPPAAPADGSETHAADGRAVYQASCAACHGAQGRGQPGFYPPLAGNPDLWKDGRLPILVVLHGLAGPIEVAGARYDSAMPPFGHLSDEQIAAVIGYVRSAWGGAPAGRAPEPITPEAVARQRGRAMTAAEVHAYRAQAQ